MRIPHQPQGYYRLSQLKQAEVFAAANRGGRISILSVVVFAVLAAIASGITLSIYREVGGTNIILAAFMASLGWALFFGPVVVRFLFLPLLAHGISKELQRRAEEEDRAAKEIR